MGLTAGLVPARVDADVKAGLLELVAYAIEEGGWSLRRSAACLGLDHARVLRWQARAAVARLDDLRPGPVEALHALLPWERDAILQVADEWLEVDRSHRKLAHRGSRLGVVHVSESTVLRVLADAEIVVPQRPARARRERRGLPEWAELVPGVIYIYDFTHFDSVKGAVIAVIDVVSRYWLATVVSAEETSTQVEIAFTRALIEDGKEHLLDEPLRAELATGVVPDHDELPVLLAMSDNGPQMTSKATTVFLASVRIATHFGRPGTPNDQAWIESFFGHIKDEFPHLDKIRDLGQLETELERIRLHYNTIRLHAGIGYVTPDDEHHGRGQAIRDARVKGMQAAAEARVAYRRQLRQDPP
jgi:transposase InsO family protein